MKVTTSKSKNSESFYIAKSFINDKGVSTSVNIRKLGTLKELIKEHGPTRDDVMAWARAEAKLETMKYKAENEAKKVKITFNTDAKIKYDRQAFHRGGYLFLQSMYYALHIDKICRKLKDKYKFEYDINSILSDMLYARILEPSSKRSSYNIANEFLEKPSYSLHDVYRALSVLGDECDFIQSEVYKNSHFIGSRNDKILYYDCTNYYFEISQEDGCKKYGKSKEHRPNPIVQMGMFMDGDGIPLAFSLFPGNSNEQTSVKPLEEKILSQFGCQKFIYCSDAGLGAERIREYNHMGKRAFIVTQSIKKLKAEERAWALNKCGFKNLYDDMSTDISNLPYDDKGIYYKEIPYTPRELHQRLIVVYSPKYARYQKTIRGKQIERAKCMLSDGTAKRASKNPNDPRRDGKESFVCVYESRASRGTIRCLSGGCHPRAGHGRRHGILPAPRWRRKCPHGVRPDGARHRVPLPRTHPHAGARKAETPDHRHDAGHPLAPGALRPRADRCKGHGGRDCRCQCASRTSRRHHGAVALSLVSRMLSR